MDFISIIAVENNNVFPYFHFWLVFISIFYTVLTKVTFKLDSSSRFFRKMRNKIFHDIMHTCKLMTEEKHYLQKEKDVLR